MHGAKVKIKIMKRCILLAVICNYITMHGHMNIKQTGELHSAYTCHLRTANRRIPNYSQQDASFLDLLIFTDALHVSGGSSAHHQEHITVHTASGIVNQYCY
jgi:hypothetical protein